MTSLKREATTYEVEPGSWCLYLLECRNGAYYTGITNDLERRFAAHATGKGAKYTRANPPVNVLAVVPFENRAEASRAEWQIKQLKKSQKVDAMLELVRETQEPLQHLHRSRPSL